MEKYHEMIADMEKGVTSFFEQFKDEPQWLSGWGHNYFCEVDGEKLQFNQNSPKEHYCKVCNHTYTGPKYDHAWIYLNRLESFFATVKSAYLYKHTGESKYYDYTRNTLLYYANNYDQFQLHAKDVIITDDLTIDVGGAGKIMPQGLNEGYMLILIIKTLTILDRDFSDEDKLIIKEKLVRSAIEDVLAPQIIRIHNIVCWIECAIAISGLYFDEQKWLDFVFTGEFNIASQLKDGVTKDYLWYEGSIHYHFFMLEAMLNLMVYEKADKLLVAQKATVKKMLVAAYHYAFDNNHFPNPNDGWPDIGLKTYLHVYHMATKVFDEDDEILTITNNIENSEIKRVPIPLAEPYYFGDIPLEKLLFNQDENRGFATIARTSYLFADSNFAMLKNDRINLFTKFGHNGASHAHPDKMTFELMVDGKMISRDLSNAGYGAEICNEWHRMSASHNTVVVDGKNHDNVEVGVVCEFNDSLIDVKCENVYQGVNFARKFELIDQQIVDTFAIDAAGVHTYDNFIHIDGKLETIDGYIKSSTLDFNQNGYQHIKNIYQITGTNCFKVHVQGVNQKISLDIDPEAEVFICETLDNPVNRLRNALVLRKKGKNVTFKVKWNF